MQECVEEISEKQFSEFLTNPLTVIDFYADWCMPCLMLAPIVDELAQKFKGKIVFAKVNIDENSNLASRFKVMSIPTILLFKEGLEVERITGALPPEVIEEKIGKHVCE